MFFNSVQTLVLVNLIPIFGVLFLGWDLGQIIALYWAENVVHGVLNVIKMSRAEQQLKSPLKVSTFSGVRYDYRKLPLILFFIVHYGIFTLVHGVFVFQLFVDTATLDVAGLFFGFVSLFVSHYISYRTNYIGSGEYQRISADSLMGGVYKRIVILHITIIFGAFAVEALGSSIAPLLILVALKTIVDYGSHVLEHKKRSTKTESV